MTSYDATIFTQFRHYRLHTDGECATLYFHDRLLARFCPIACNLEFGDELFGDDLLWHPKAAARRWLQHHEARLRMNILYHPGNDIAYAERILHILNPYAEFKTSFVITGEPYPKPRPRFSKSGHAYSTKEMRAREEDTAWQIKPYFPEPCTGNLAIACIFFRSTRRRVDVDNLVKHVLDAAQGVAFVDDDQVTAKLGVLEYDRDNPRTIIALCDHETSMVRLRTAS